MTRSIYSFLSLLLLAMASPNPVLSEDVKAVGTQSASPYQLVYGMEDDISDGSLPTSPRTDLPQPLSNVHLGTEKALESLPYPSDGVPMNGVGSNPHTQANSNPADKSLPMQSKEKEPLVGGDLVPGADCRPPSVRAESPLSLTDVKMEDTSMERSLQATSTTTTTTTTTTTDLSRPLLPPSYTPARPPPYTPTPQPSPSTGKGGEPLPLKVPPDLEESVVTVDTESFSVSYLGHSAVDAPKSENEASRKMETMKKQVVDPMQIEIVIPVMNEGCVVLLDPRDRLPLVKFPIKYILFCARGRTEDTMDCLCINVRAQVTTDYHCYVFKAPTADIVSVV